MSIYKKGFNGNYYTVERLERYYKHFKGGKYVLMAIARDSESLEKVVVYKALYGDGQVWTRPYEMFFGNVVINGQIKKRFVEITKEEAYAK